MQTRNLLQVWIVFLLLFACDHLVAQTWNGTAIPTTTSNYNTSIRLTHIEWGSHHGILFNSHPRSILNDGNLLDNGNVEQEFDAGPYGSGAGAIMFLGNGGRMDFLISGPSSGAGQPVDWGGPKLTIQRNGNIGIGTYDPADQLEIENGNRKVGFNTAMSGTSAGGLLSLSRPRDGHKVVYVGGASDDDHVVFGGGGSTEMRLVSGGGTSAGFGFYLNMPVENAFGVRSGLPLPVVKIDGDGDVGIGTSQPDQKLTVKGTIHAEEVKVDLAVPGPDYVFEKDYALLTLPEVQEFINKNKHLPQVPSTKEMQENGLNLKEMNLILLRKVEELTLYAIDQKKISEDQASTTSVLNNRINKLENRRDMLELFCALLITIVLTLVGAAKWKSPKTETKNILERG